MHGRILTIAAAVVGWGLTCAAPALADQQLSLGQPAGADGVVVSWRIQTTTRQTVRLRSTQTLTATGTPTTTTTATSDPVVAGASGAQQTVAARLPIAAGGRLELVGATAWPTVDATVEPDADGDGYGDTTQDACPGNATDHDVPCNGVQTFGSPLTLAPDAGLSSSGGVVQAMQQDAAGTTPTITKAGILTRWRLRADPAKADTILQLLRPTGDGASFDVLMESPITHVASSDVVTMVEHFPVRPGDRLAVRSIARGTVRDLGAIAAHAGDELVVDDPPRSVGQTWTPDATYPAADRLLAQADVEPDADGDGKGDVSEDSADLQVMGAAPASVQATAGWSHTYTVSNRGPDTALGVSVEISGAGVTPPPAPPAGVSCADTPGVAASGVSITCTLDRLPPGASFALVPAFVVPAIWPPPTGTITTTAIATAATPDPDSINDRAQLTTVVWPYVPNLPPTPPLQAPPCANVMHGTRDDDVLRGTPFGDRLVGGDGADLLKGGAGDDCLEGGAATDVLDGGDGNDRLAGASGRDRLLGGSGNDKLTGGSGNDRLSGGPGNDALSPGSGRDSVDAGGGNDTINSVDGVRETIDCGAGRDTVRADRRDRLKHCEKVTRRR